MIKQSTFLKIYIIPFMFISPFMTISCNSWFSMWMIMEFNLMNFIPLIIFYNKYYKEISFKYFIIQTLSSSMILLTSNSLLMNINYSMIISLIINMINLSIFMKLGSAPFHFWFINIMKNMNWINCLILSTWQKLIPLIILTYIYLKNLNYMIILLSSMTGAIFGLNQQSIRIILSYSSINHISWLLINLMISEYLWMMYFISYLLMNLSLMMMFKKFKIYYINQIYNNYLKLNKFFMMINMISISGLPPMFGFLMKWMSIFYINWNKSFMIMILMIMMSILTFIFYMQLIMSFMLINSINNKLMLLNKFNTNKMKLLIMTSMNFNLNLWILTMWMF